MREMWVTKYSPKKLTDYVFRDNQQKVQCESWVKQEAIPHLLLSGTQGVGKTSLAKVLMNELGIQKGDILFLNASQENDVETIRKKVIGFASTMPMGDYFLKYIILDEADHLSIPSQAILRGVMEQYADNCRFILTCNYPQKIIPAISNSRCQRFHIEKVDMNAFMLRIIDILGQEGIAVDEANAGIVNTFVQASYPDLRKCINMVQQNVIDGQLIVPSTSDTGGDDDWKIAAIQMFEEGKILQGRDLVVKQVRADEFEEVYSMLYRNLEWWGDDIMKQTEATLCIRDNLCKHVTCADPEMNLSSTFIELCKIRHGEVYAY